MSVDAWLVALLVILAGSGIASLHLAPPERHDTVAPRVRRPVTAVFAGSLAAVFAVSLAYADPSSSSQQLSPPQGPPASLAQVLRLVSASQAITRVPNHMVPSLAQIGTSTFGRLVGVPPPACIAGTADRRLQSLSRCTFGDTHATRTIVLYGDSVAAMWFRALDDIALEAHWRLIPLTKFGCPAGLIPTHPTGAFGDWQACDSWHTYALGEIARLRPDVVVISQEVAARPNGAPYSPLDWGSGLDRLLSRLHGVGHHVAVLGSIIRARGPTCVAAHPHDVGACAPLQSNEARRFITAERRATIRNDASFIDVTPWLCARRCSPIIGGYDVYADTAHITDAYARHLEGVLAQSLRL